MFGIALVTLRECAELALIVYFLLDCRRQLGGDPPWFKVPLAAALGASAGAVAMAALGLSPVATWVQSLLTAAVALLIILLVAGGLETVSRIRRSIQSRLAERAPQSADRLAMSIALISGLREGVEWALQTRTLADGLTLLDTGLGVALGLATTLVLAMLWPRLPRIVGATAIFRLSAIALAMIAADMLVNALGDLIAPMLGTVPGLAVAADRSGDPLPFMDTLRVALMAAIVVAAMHRWWRGLR